MRRRKGRVYRITEAPKALSDDVSSRQRKYAISMGVRAVAFVVAAVAPLPIPLRVLLIIAALVIPYVAVVYANGGREPVDRSDSPYTPSEPRAIDPTITVLGPTPDDHPDDRRAAQDEPPNPAAPHGPHDRHDPDGSHNPATGDDSADTADPTDTVSRDDTVSRADTADIAGPADTTAPTDTAAPADPTPTETASRADTAGSAGPTGPTGTAEPAGPTGTAGSAGAGVGNGTNGVKHGTGRTTGGGAGHDGDVRASDTAGNGTFRTSEGARERAAG